MELSGAGYLYAIASLAMALVAFSAIVLTLQQITDARDPKRLKILRQHARAYIELGLSSVGAAMLPPSLAACGVPPLATWRWSSLIIAIGFIYHACLILKRFIAFQRSADLKIPLRIIFATAVNALVIISLLLNVTGLLFEPSAAPVVVAASWRFVAAIIAFMLTYEEFLDGRT